MSSRKNAGLQRVSQHPDRLRYSFLSDRMILYLPIHPAPSCTALGLHVSVISQAVSFTKARVVPESRLGSYDKPAAGYIDSSLAYAFRACPSIHLLNVEPSSTPISSVSPLSHSTPLLGQSRCPLVNNMQPCPKSASPALFGLLS